MLKRTAQWYQRQTESGHINSLADIHAYVHDAREANVAWCWDDEIDTQTVTATVDAVQFA